ncbi:LytR/AlgR family response regulator transcription factor [Flagellimonas nanhaiensis]|uniref:DNA-binding response regulator n=1 Tax=Flagellimonas nanhaiensis TaxID=2292706 RepID=A0A371JRR1_9FLAO|nr:LytTR family DNA-binding domain-containing protein [Allomuricauda nanhaiensis]RDY60202.1 DNA-binding response regulator [Allomuricauda nanhaiensis]
MLNAIIVDDEQHCIDRLTELLQRHKDSIKIISNCKTIEEAEQQIKVTQPDVVFLDVHLNNATGFDLLSLLPKMDFEVVFTTSYDTYALKAFKFSALDYLLKPIASEDLENAVQKIVHNRSLKETSQKIDVLFHNFKDGIVQPKRMAIPTVEGFTMIEINNIVRFQSDANYTHVHTVTNKKVTAAKTLKYFEEILGSHNFFRIHKSHLINLSFVDNYIKGKGGYVTLLDGSKIEVAVRRKEELLKRLAF